MSNVRNIAKEKLMQEKIATIIAFGKVARTVYIFGGILELVACVLFGVFLCVSSGGGIIFFPFIVIGGVILCVLSIIFGKFVEAMLYTYAQTVVNIKNLSDCKMNEPSFILSLMKKEQNAPKDCQTEVDIQRTVCEKCGLVHAKDAKFCSGCGNSLI